MRTNRTRSLHDSGISRRGFLGAAAAGTGLSLLRSRPALARALHRSELLRDYVGRLCYNENPLGPSPAAIAAITDAAPMGHRYPDWYAESLLADLASYHGVSASNVIAGCGGTEILRLAALAFADPMGNVVCPYPSYDQFPADCEFLGAEVRYAPLDANRRVDLNAMAALVDGSTIAVCITNPNNPTATVRSAADIAAFVQALPPGVVFVIDEAYHYYVHDPSYGSAVDLVKQGKNVVVVRTFSKAHGLAGVRVGYAVGKQSQIAAMSTWHLFATVSRLALEAARAALDDAQHIADTVALNDQAKEYCFTNFTSMGLPYIPSETNFFMVDVGSSAASVASQLAARGIQVRTGWGMPRHLRVSTGTMEDMQNFITALRDILGLPGVGEDGQAQTTALYGNFPNPVRRSTNIRYSLREGNDVSIDLYDLHGRHIRRLLDQAVSCGHHDLPWDATDAAGRRVAAGSYFYRMTAGGITQTRRLIVVD